MKHLQRLAAAAALVALLGAGCGSSSAPGATGSPSGSNPGNVVSQRSGCLNDYYPLKNNSSITYKMTGSNTAGVPFTVKVTNVTETSATLTYTFTVRGRDVSVTNNISCEGGTIRANGYLDLATAISGMNISFETKSMEGEIIPSDISVGKEWDQKTVVTMHTTDERMKAMIDGKDQTVTTHNKVIGEESVTVAAGTFTARKIQQDITISNSLLPNGITNRTTSWFVKGVGLVKSESTSMGSTSGMEATAINN